MRLQELQNLTEATARDLRAQMEREGGPGSAAAEVALLARECKDAKLESEFLRRIEALEAKVGDRDGLLQRLSRQQARLDRLENLARENEILKAQMRGEHRQHPSKAAGTGGFQAERAGKDQSLTRRLAVNRQASGRLRHEERPAEVKIMTARDEAAMRREAVSPGLEETTDAEARSSLGDRHVAARVLPPGHGPVRQVHRCSSSGNVSPPVPERVAAPLRRMVSAPQEFAVPSEAREQPQSSELETRLEELEFALGLQPGACSKPTLQRPLRDNSNAVFRERSV